jgi:hypothetical protein
MLVIVAEIGAETATFAPVDHRQGYVSCRATYLVDDLSSIRVGQVGELESLEVEGERLFSFAVDGRRTADLVWLTAVGPHDGLLFRQRGTSRQADALDLAGHGIAAQYRQQAASLLAFWLLTGPDGAPDGPPFGRFAIADLAGWVEIQAAAKRRRDAEAGRRHLAQEAARIEQDYHGYFVNPYTFVSLPVGEDLPQRYAPRGHAVWGAGYLSGRLTGVLRARSPLLIRNIDRDCAGFPRRPHPETGAAVEFIPGSSLHGAVRSLHETLTGSCLRVFDPDFVPAYRDEIKPDLRLGWTLGLVEKVDDGRPVAIVQCEQVRWVRATTLATARTAAGLDEVVETGQRYELADGPTRSAGSSRVVHLGAVTARDGDDGQWIALVTNPSARAKKGSRYIKPYYCALGRLPNKEDPRASLTDPAWRAYGRAVAHARIHSGTETEPEHRDEKARVSETGLGSVLGVEESYQQYGPDGEPVEQSVRIRWYKPRRWFFEQQVAWVTQARPCTGIALAVAWRSPATGKGERPAAAAGERVRGFQPCDDAQELCPSCRMFGSADVRTDADRRQAEQRAYRGHLRFADAIRIDGGTETVVLPRMGSPRPGAGQFYLSHPAALPASQSGRNTSPGRWGSELDSPNPRTLRGRKYYWQTDPATDRRRGRWRAHTEHDAPAEDTEAELATEGSTFAVTIWFENLERVELGGLIAALQPHLLLAGRLPYQIAAEPQFAIHVGGGKPLGLSSCLVEDLTVEAHTASSRYRGGPVPALDPAGLVEEFAAAHGGLSQVWSQVAAALHTRHVDSRIVGYPTTVRWHQDGTCRAKKQHEHFEWFQRADGVRLSTETRPYEVLPPVIHPQPALPVAVDPEPNR